MSRIILIAVAQIIMTRAVGCMDLTALYTLQTRLAAEERHTQREIAHSLESIEQEIPLRQRVFNPKKLSDPARFLAIHFITKGCSCALEQRALPSEQSGLISYHPSYGSVEHLSDEPLEQDVLTTFKQSQDALSKLKDHIAQEDIDRIVSLYTGAFTIIACTNPALYSSALCWAVSCNSLSREEREAFDKKCYRDCAQLIKAYTKVRRSSCCTIL